MVDSAPCAIIVFSSGEIVAPSMPISTSLRITTLSIVTVDCAIVRGAKRRIMIPAKKDENLLPMSFGNAVTV
jgi:hypothetical protein